MYKRQVLDVGIGKGNGDVHMGLGICSDGDGFGCIHLGIQLIGELFHEILMGVVGIDPAASRALCQGTHIQSICLFYI